MRAALAIGLALSLGCAKAPVIVPPLTPETTNTYNVGRFVWYDLLTDDLEGAKRFYGELFGWTFEDGGDEAAVYTAIRSHGRLIGGIAFTPRMQQQVNVSQWVSSISVADVDRAVVYVRSSGGEVLAEPQDLPDRGRVAVVRDRQNALIALVHSEVGDPPERDPEIGEWLWTELWTRDAAASISFYEGLVGYEPERWDSETPGEYYMLNRDGKPRAGLLAYQFENVEPNWLPYVRVENPSELVARVEALGGRVLIPPRPDIRGGSVAVIADPSGAAVTIQKWPPEG